MSDRVVPKLVSIILVIQMRPATEALSSHFESVQKATIAGFDLEDI